MGSCSVGFFPGDFSDRLTLAKAVIFGDRHDGNTALETEAHDAGFYGILLE